MKKHLGLSVCAAVLLAACNTTPQTSSTAPVPKVGIANPASEFCVKQGGSLEIKKEPTGEVGYCKMNGQVIEEWEYFRSQQAKCDADEAAQLVGQSSLSEQQIKDKTKAGSVRQLGPNQPMTMDYREDRVTVIIEPTSKKIVKANCG